MRTVLLGLALLVAGGLAAPDVAPAHVRPALDAVADAAPPAPAPPSLVSIAAATPEPVPLWPLATGLAVAALALTAVAPRRAFRVALVLLIAVSAIETGVHSVHHLADREAASCAVALASANVQGASMETPCTAVSSPTPVGTVVVADPTRPGARLVRSDEGRAPPA